MLHLPNKSERTSDFNKTPYSLTFCWGFFADKVCLEISNFIVNWYSASEIQHLCSAISNLQSDDILQVKFFLANKNKTLLFYRMSSCRVIILCSCVALTITSIQHVSRKTAQGPWTSCNGFVGFPSILTCYSFCFKVFDNLYLFSRDDITKTCYCCDQVPGLSDQYLSNSEKVSFKTGR